MNIQQIKKILQENQSWAKKAYGQHFLVDESVLDTIIWAAELKSTDRVVEIGPGLGVLTQRLVQSAKEVVAIESDQTLVKLLHGFMASWMENNETMGQCNNLTIVEGDALQVVDRLEFKEEFLKSGYKVVANIPYSITSKLLRLFLENVYQPKSLTLLIQKEVAERIIAKPGEMSLLSLSVQYYGEAKIISFVPASAFWPAPKVESAVIQIALSPKSKVQRSGAERVFRLARIGFSSKRKTLANNLSSGLRLERDKVVAIIKSAGLKDTARSQELSVQNWLDLTKLF